MQADPIRRQLTRLPRNDEGEPRYFHPHGYVIEKQRRTWSERVGAMRGQAGTIPLRWWTVHHHIAKRRAMLEGRPDLFLTVVSERYGTRDFDTLGDARAWCDENPREGWIPAQRFLCACGCGAEVDLRRTQIAGQPQLNPSAPRRFIQGHHQLTGVAWRPEDRGYETPCHIWQRGKAPNGYGITTHAGRRMGAHRAAWIIAHGPIPAGMQVCHRCDVRACVNADHLFLGTGRDNMQDAASKDRLARRRGEESSQAKLTWAQVDAIRASTDTQTALATRYGVSQAAVWKIVRGKAWQR